MLGFTKNPEQLQPIHTLKSATRQALVYNFPKNRYKYNVELLPIDHKLGDYVHTVHADTEAEALAIATQHINR